MQSVLGALNTSAFVHISAHGAHVPENAMYSQLELADAPLFAHHLTAIRTPPRHVVLAAGELALNVVGDKAAHEAMRDYHHGLATGLTAAAAIARAVSVDPLRRPFIYMGADS